MNLRKDHYHTDPRSSTMRNPGMVAPPEGLLPACCAVGTGMDCPHLMCCGMESLLAFCPAGSCFIFCLASGPLVLLQSMALCRPSMGGLHNCCLLLCDESWCGSSYCNAESGITSMYRSCGAASIHQQTHNQPVMINKT